MATGRRRPRAPGALSRRSALRLQVRSSGARHPNPELSAPACARTTHHARMRGHLGKGWEGVQSSAGRRFGPTRIQRLPLASRRVLPSGATCRVRHDPRRHARGAARPHISRAPAPRPAGTSSPQTAAPNRRGASNAASPAHRRRAAEPSHAATTDSPRQPRTRATRIFRRGL